MPSKTWLKKEPGAGNAAGVASIQSPTALSVRRVEAERLADDQLPFEKPPSVWARRRQRRRRQSRRGAARCRRQSRQKASEVFDDAKTHYQGASQVYDTSAVPTPAAATAGVLESQGLIKANPGKAAVVSSLVLGVDGLFWIDRSADRTALANAFALPVYGLRKAVRSSTVTRANRKNSSAAELGELNRKRIEFERNIANTSARLLGAFSCSGCGYVCSDRAMAVSGAD